MPLAVFRTAKGIITLDFLHQKALNYHSDTFKAIDNNNSVNDVIIKDLLKVCKRALPLKFQTILVYSHSMVPVGLGVTS